MYDDRWSISCWLRRRSGIRLCGVCKKTRRAIGVIDFMRAMAANDGAILPGFPSFAGLMAWHELHQVSARARPAATLSVSCARTGSAAARNIAPSNGAAMVRSLLDFLRTVIDGALTPADITGLRAAIGRKYRVLFPKTRELWSGLPLRAE